MLSGIDAWKRFESMKSMNARAPFGFLAPSSTPASSIWRKQLSATTAVGAVFGGVFAKITSAAGLVA